MKINYDTYQFSIRMRLLSLLQLNSSKKAIKNLEVNIKYKQYI